MNASIEVSSIQAKAPPRTQSGLGRSFSHKTRNEMCGHSRRTSKSAYRQVSPSVIMENDSPDVLPIAEGRRDGKPLPRQRTAASLIRLICLPASGAYLDFCKASTASAIRLSASVKRAREQAKLSRWNPSPSPWRPNMGPLSVATLAL